MGVVKGTVKVSDIPDDPQFDPWALALEPLEDLPLTVPEEAPTVQDGVEAMFYIAGGGFTKKGDLTVTIAFPKESRGVGLALLDVQGRMVHGQFSSTSTLAGRIDDRGKKEAESGEVKDGDAIRRWYEEQFGRQRIRGGRTSP